MESTYFGVSREVEAISDEFEIVASELNRFLLSFWRGIPSPMANAATTMNANTVRPHFVHFRAVNFSMPKFCDVSESLASSTLTTSGSEVL